MMTTTTYGAGDTTLLCNLLPLEESCSLFSSLSSQIQWENMFHHGGEVPRLVAVQYSPLAPHNDQPIYRHPSDTSIAGLPFSPLVQRIREQVETEVGHSFNHCLLQYYRSGEDHISEHSDKTLDIQPDTFIANVSIGALRTMTLRTKSQQKSEERQKQQIPLPHNSLLIMGLKTNAEWLHGIRVDRRIPTVQTNEENAYEGARISLTFRAIHTYRTDNGCIWGAGAMAKRREDARAIALSPDPIELKALIEAFGRENRASTRNWEAFYGKGSDVVNMKEI